MDRGVNFYPTGWTDDNMFSFAKRNLDNAKAGINSMPKSSFRFFMDIPLLLAEATLNAIQSGVGKLSREQVMQIVGQTS
jgi:farnesyl-diphosphate farnesyltransferase